MKSASVKQSKKWDVQTNVRTGKKMVVETAEVSKSRRMIDPKEIRKQIQICNRNIEKFRDRKDMLKEMLEDAKVAEEADSKFTAK